VAKLAGFCVAAAVALAGCARAGVSAMPAGTDLSAAQSSPVVIIVRHAEKAPEPANDPVLSASGIARAAALDSAVRGMQITDVVVSHLQRTRLTAAQFISRSGAALHVVPIGAAGVPAHVRALSDTVRAITRIPGHGVLVVGHSNTVTQIIEALGGPALPALCDSQYSRFFVLSGVAPGTVSVARSTYGASDPADPTCAAMQPKPQ
jgi:phosphohistidine phosphatase SixA